MLLLEEGRTEGQSLLTLKQMGKTNGVQQRQLLCSKELPSTYVPRLPLTPEAVSRESSQSDSPDVEA